MSFVHLSVCIRPVDTPVIMSFVLSVSVSGIAARTARVLLLMVIPGQIIFMLTIKYLQTTKSVNVDFAFAVVYLSAAFIQVK